MSHPNQVTLPARLILGHATFLDPEKPGVAVADVAYRDPRHPGSVAFDGLRIYVADTIPLRLSPSELRGELEGEPFSAAILQALPRSKLMELFARRGEALSDSEVAQLQMPLMRLALEGDVVIAAAPSPPTPDPVYVRFSANMLGHWRFVPGMDMAVPIFPAALEYLAVRVFSPASWSRVEVAGGRLRARLVVEAVSQERTGTSGRPSSAHLARAEMLRRAQAGTMKARLIDEAAALCDWLAEQHPSAPQPKPKSLADSLREEHRERCRKP